MVVAGHVTQWNQATLYAVNDSGDGVYISTNNAALAASVGIATDAASGGTNDGDLAMISSMMAAADAVVPSEQISSRKAIFNVARLAAFMQGEEIDATVAAPSSLERS